jgi:hypothetical protein
MATSDFIKNKEFTGIEETDRGTLYMGAPDPVTGQRYQEYVQKSPSAVAGGLLPVSSLPEVRARQQALGQGATPYVLPTNDNTGGGQGYSVSGSESMPGDYDSAYSRASSLLDGLESPMTQEDIARREEDERMRLEQQAASIFNPRIQEASRIGRKQVGSAEAQVGVARGLGLSTAEVSFINSIQSEVDNNIKEIEAAKTEFIANGNFQAKERADKALENLRTTKIELALKKANLTLDFMNQARSDKEFSLQQQQFDYQRQADERKSIYEFASAELGIISQIPAGQTLNLGGKNWTGIAVSEVEPFFSGGDVVNIMKDLPFGETAPIYDPNTGQTIEVTGLKATEPNTRAYQFTDANNNIMVATVDEYTGSIINAVKVGKAKATGTGTGTAAAKEIKDAADRNMYSEELNKIRGEDGYVNPILYAKLRERVATENPGQLKWFTQDAYPVSTIMNPENPASYKFILEDKAEQLLPGIGLKSNEPKEQTDEYSDTVNDLKGG